MRTVLGVSVSLLLTGAVLGVAGEAAPAPAFAKRPTATKAGDKVKIDFAVDRETDVAVFIENGGGKIVRHLVAGVLGKNPPAPLKPGLAHSVEWDGLADYGRPAGAGPFKVRVALGMGAKYDKVLLSDAHTFTDIKALSVRRDGTLFVAHRGGHILPSYTIRAFNRDGSYQRVVMPFPSNLTPEQAKGFGAFDLNGRPAPMANYSELDSLHRGGIISSVANMGMTPDGVLLWMVSPRYPPGYLIGVDTNSGGAVWNFKELPGQPLNMSCVESASDGKSVLVGGLGRREGSVVYPALYRFQLPDGAKAETFFGDPAKAGNDETHLGAAGAAGLALDGKGHVLISDPANGRVVVVGEKDGKFAGSFPINGPGCIAVDPAGGAVYVLAGGAGAKSVVKLRGWKEPKELARILMSKPVEGGDKIVMALDAAAKPSIVWVGTGPGQLLRIEDGGDKFGEPRDLSNANMGAASFLNVRVDRFRPDPEIYTRCGGHYPRTWWWRFNEGSGKAEQVRVPDEVGGGAGINLMPAPDGNLYGLRWPIYFLKYDRSGKPSAWEQPDHRPLAKGEAFSGKWKDYQSYVPVPMGDTPETMGIRGSDGHIFVLEGPKPGNRGEPKMLHEYLPTGKRVTTDPILKAFGDSVVGPRFDAAGNIYIADIIAPKDWYYPPEFDKALPAKIKLDRRCAHDDFRYCPASMYGSIIKFSPKGGAIDCGPAAAEPKLDPSLKTVEYSVGGPKPVNVTGAEWVYPGISHLGVSACTCEKVSFDVDEFGRVWFPDLNLFQVRVIDTNGNALTKFGGYGNAESMGPDSKDKSLAQPEIAFAWLVGVAATDKYVYAGDSLNRRLLRAKIVYAAEETCEVR